MANTTEMQPVELPLEAIEVSEELNARKTRIREKGADSIESLRRAIKSEGQLSPVLVRDLGGNNYLLIAGFRRYQACSKLGKTIRAIVVPPVEGGDSTVEDMYLNLSENLNREDLNPYDLSLRCMELSDMGESGADIGKRIGKTKSYVNKLIKIQRNVCTEILNAWVEGDKRCTVPYMDTLSALEEGEQLDHWHGVGGQEGAAHHEPAGGKPSLPGTKRASKKQLEAALASLSDCKLNEEQTKGARKALRFALGYLTNKEGKIYFPSVWDGNYRKDEDDE